MSISSHGSFSDEDVDLHGPLLVAYVREWGARHAVAAGTSERQAVAIATYVELCAPAGAGRRRLAVAAELTSLFFHLDDAPGSLISRAVATAGDVLEPSGLPALDAFLAEFVELNQARATNRARFLSSLRIWMAAIVEELTIDFAAIDFSRHLDLRRRNAFIDPYVDVWLVLLDLEVSRPLADAALRARHAARDVIIFANDLGSWHRDRVVGGELADPNLVATRARESGGDEAGALAWVLDRHDLAMEAFDVAVEQLKADAEGRRYADLVTAIVRGNVEAMRRLSDRYDGAAPLLDRLRMPRG